MTIGDHNYLIRDVRLESGGSLTLDLIALFRDEAPFTITTDEGQGIASDRCTLDDLVIFLTNS
jgi:hypothetical protein